MGRFYRKVDPLYFTNLNHEQRALRLRYFHSVENGENKKMKKRKPCFICGDNGQHGKLCKQVNECLICLRKGHLVVDCPCKNEEVDITSRLCLKCGSIGHDMFSCGNDYTSEDLKDIQCYVCRKLGHLSCVDNKFYRVREASCYNCGGSGHFGSDCIKSNEEVNDLQPEQLCSKGESKDHSQEACTKESKVGQDEMAAKSAKVSKNRRRKKNKTIPMVNESQMAHTRSFYALKDGSTNTSRNSLDQQTRGLLHSHQTIPMVNASQSETSSSNMAHTRSLYAVKFGSTTTARENYNEQTRGLLYSHQNYNNQVRTQVPGNSTYPITQLEHQQGTQNTHHHNGVQPHHIYTGIYQDSFYPTAPRPQLTWNGLRGTQIPQQPFIHQTENLFPQPINQVYTQPINHQARNMYPRPITQIQQSLSYPVGNVFPQAICQFNHPSLNYTTGIILPHPIRAPVPQNVPIRIEIRPPFPNYYNRSRS